MLPTDDPRDAAHEIRTAPSVRTGNSAFERSAARAAARAIANCIRTIAVLALLAAAGPLIADPIFDAEEGHAVFAGLLRAGLFGMMGFERAAFLVRDGDGPMRCEMWPATRSMRAESFRGTLPTGTVAIVHTHPIEWPLPSEHDMEEATRLHVPIYVVTKRNVYKAMPGASWPDVVVRDRIWSRNDEPAVRCAELR